MSSRRRGTISSALALTIVFTTATAASALTLHSSAFPNGGEMPANLTCTAAGHSPPLDWSGAPKATQSFALIVTDPDAPDPRAPTKTVIHWIMYNIPPTITSLTEGMNGAPAGGRDGANEGHETGYMPPCPPVGRHRYFHKLYALDRQLPNLGAATKEALEAAMKGHVLQEDTLIGTYAKQAGAK